MPNLRIEYMPLSELVRAPRNPKEHHVQAIAESVERFGYVSPLILDDATGKLVAGHGRLDALQAMKAQGRAAPERVQVHDGEWLVPVVRGVSFGNAAEAEAYLVADNRTTELGGWDEVVLADVLSDLAAQETLEGTGWDSEEVDNLIAAQIKDVLKTKRRLTPELLERHDYIVFVVDNELDWKAICDEFELDTVYYRPPEEVSAGQQGVNHGLGRVLMASELLQRLRPASGI